jgi:hypothetical protein
MENPMRLSISALVLLVFAMVPAFGATTTAPTANYDIEVLVFAIQVPQYEGGELWTRAEQPIDTADAVFPRELSPSADFNRIAQKLSADDHFRVLLRKHWRQVGDTKSNVPPVLLTSGNNELNGTLRFYLSRFLHVELNLMYEPEPSLIGAITAPDFTIHEQRRVRSNEMSYFDNPKFGAIVRVSPLKS